MRRQEQRHNDEVRAIALAMERHQNNAFIHQEQERHHRDYLAGRPYQEYAPWVDYSQLRDQPQEVQQQVGWPQGVASSFVPIPEPPPPQNDPFDFNEMFSSLTGYPYHPYPPRDPNERYQR